MVELIIFLVLSIALFIYLLIKYIKKNKRKFYVYLFIYLSFIIIFIINYLINKQHSNFIRVLSYLISIILPAIAVFIEELGYDFREGLLLALIKILLIFKNKKLSKKLIFKFLKKRPHSYALHKKLGDIYKEEGGIRKALNEYIIAINLKQVPSLFLEVTEMFYDLGNIEEAKEGLIYILSKEPDFLEAYLFLADIYLEQEKFKDAARTYKEALQCFDEKGDYEIYYKLGILYSRVNEFKFSKEYFEKALKLVDKEILHFYIAQIILIENNIPRAVDKFKELLDSKLLRPYVLYELARIAVYREEKHKAISYINEAIRLEEKLKERAFNDYIFSNIKSEFLLSVKLDEDEIEIVKEKIRNQTRDKEVIRDIENILETHKKEKPSILQKLKFVEIPEVVLTEEELDIIIHLSNTSSLITNMGEITSQEKTKSRVDRIFKQKFDQIEVENQILEEQQNTINEDIEELEDK